jgi:hypothetical protein
VICGKALVKPIVQVPGGRAHFACADHPRPRRRQRSGRGSVGRGAPDALPDRLQR